MNNAIKDINVMNLSVDTKDPSIVLNKLISTEKDMLRFMLSHATTSVVSTFTQFIAMTVLLEGRSGKSLLYSYISVGKKMKRSSWHSLTVNAMLVGSPLGEMFIPKVHSPFR